MKIKILHIIHKYTFKLNEFVCNLIVKEFKKNLHKYMREHND